MSLKWSTLCDDGNWGVIESGVKWGRILLLETKQNK